MQIHRESARTKYSFWFIDTAYRRHAIGGAMAYCSSGSTSCNALRSINITQSVQFSNEFSRLANWTDIWFSHFLCVSLIRCSIKDLQALGQTETKLVYTLHWILLFAAAECADEEADSRQLQEARAHLFSIPTITLFVYLFAPIAHHLKESDFQNYRLEHGLPIWHGMWDYGAPYGAPCFTSAVKPKARQLLNSLLSPRESLDAYCPNREFFFICFSFKKCFSCRWPSFFYFRFS